MAWTTTSLNAGPLTNNSYNMTITGLSGSTKYRYRAYFVVDGVAYYGNILSGTTAALTYSMPTITTGNVFHIPTTTGFIVTGNTITDNGNSPIIEYGLLYTQLAAWGTSANLVYGNYPTYVLKTSKISDVPTIPYTYTTGTTGLAAGTNTYYRAFAKNAFGIAYGDIKTQTTATPPPTNMTVSVDITWNHRTEIGTTDGFNGTYRLRCYTGVVVQSISVPLYRKYSEIIWTVPTGCYNVDFSGLSVRINGASIAGWDIEWYMTGDKSGISCSTDDFGGNVNISAELPITKM